MSRTRHSTCSRLGDECSTYDGGGRSGRVDRVASSPGPSRSSSRNRCRTWRDGLASARSAWPVGIHADVHIPAVCVHVTQPRLKAVAGRCCDRHNPLNHLAREVGAEPPSPHAISGRNRSKTGN